MPQSSRQGHLAKTKRPYVAPKLIEFGAVAALTASGSGMQTEGADGMSGMCMRETNRMTC